MVGANGGLRPQVPGRLLGGPRAAPRPAWRSYTWDLWSRVAAWEELAQANVASAVVALQRAEARGDQDLILEAHKLLADARNERDTARRARTVLQTTCHDG